MTDLDLRTDIALLEFRIAGLLQLIDSSGVRHRNALAVCEKANARQAETILKLRQQVTDAEAGIEWRDAEIKCLTNVLESTSRDRELLAKQTFMRSTS